MKIKKYVQSAGIIIPILFMLSGCGEGSQASSLSVNGNSYEVRKGTRAELGMYVLLHYELKDENGNLLDSTYERDQLFGFTLGSESVNTALQKGVIGMKVKQKKKIQVLVEQVHLSPSPNWLHPKNILTYEVKLMKIRSR